MRKYQQLSTEKLAEMVEEEGHTDPLEEGKDSNSTANFFPDQNIWNPFVKT